MWVSNISFFLILFFNFNSLKREKNKDEVKNAKNFHQQQMTNSQGKIFRRIDLRFENRGINRFYNVNIYKRVLIY